MRSSVSGKFKETGYVLQKGTTVIEILFFVPTLIRILRKGKKHEVARGNPSFQWNISTEIVRFLQFSSSNIY